ncbi:MAG: DUF4175 domain-containing protein [Parvularculaceae bacterium]
MTTELAQSGGGREQRAPGADARQVMRARLAILSERLAPVAAMAGAPVAMIAALGLFDLWRFAGFWGHALGLALLLALSGVIVWRRRPSPFWPLRGDALARLERDSAMRHEPLRALEDMPAAGAGALWEAHLAEAAARAQSPRLVAPAATANSVDPYGARYAALGVLVIGAIVAGRDGPARLVDAFRPSDQAIARAGFADLWIEPPAYTGKAPVYLLRANEALAGLREQIDAPEGSIVRVLTKTNARYRLAFRSEAATVKATRDGGETSGRATLAVNDSGVLVLSAGGRTGRWPIGVIDDRAPAVDYVEPPATDRDGRLSMAVRIDDDYGASAAHLALRLDPGQPRPLDAPAIDPAIAGKTEIIPLDALKGPAGTRGIALDLSSHPWAGLSVIASVVVTDAAQQEAQTLPVTLTLPAREFFNPLARAVIEQRQSLAVAPEDWRRVEWAFSGLTLGPEYYFDRPTDYLLLRTAMWRVNKRAGESTDATVDEFWPLALQLENEALELARQQLDAARDALRDALEKGASDTEIEQRTEALRNALQQYLEALAQSGLAPDPNAPPADQTVTAADLEAMLDAVRDLAKSGAANAARQALADLENLLDNLNAPRRASGGEAGQSGQTGSPAGAQAGGEAGGQAGAVGDLIARQRALADEAFRRGNTQGAAGDDLAADQGALAGELGDLTKSLEGESNIGDSAKALSRALDAMRRSESALAGENFAAAGDAMEEAIANLRDGAEALSRAERAKAQAARGQGGQPMRDPLGRPVGEPTGQGVDVPEMSDAQRARELLDELRRRLSDGERTEEEIEYLERLLERF